MSATILVVEDDPEINELIGEYLALESIRYVKASSGKEGIHLATTQHPDAIILDLMLPDIHGFEVARTLTSQRTTHDTPIIILTCMCQDVDIEKGFASGALSFMNKPFLPDDLLAAVRTALAWKAELNKRVPTQAITFPTQVSATATASPCGSTSKELIACTKAINQMTADLFTHTDLSDNAIAAIREGIEELAAWSAKWNADHKEPSKITLEYRVKMRGLNGTPDARNGNAPHPPLIEWTLREDAPGLLADAFFKPAPNVSTGIAGLIGWGGSGTQSKAIAPPPAKWNQLLAKTGATTFEKDPATKTIRFSRPNPGTLNASSAAAPLAPTGPLVANATR